MFPGLFSYESPQSEYFRSHHRPIIRIIVALLCVESTTHIYSDSVSLTQTKLSPSVLDIKTLSDHSPQNSQNLSHLDVLRFAC